MSWLATAIGSIMWLDVILKDADKVLCPKLTHLVSWTSTSPWKWTMCTDRWRRCVGLSCYPSWSQGVKRGHGFPPYSACLNQMNHQLCSNEGPMTTSWHSIQLTVFCTRAVNLGRPTFTTGLPSVSWTIWLHQLDLSSRWQSTNACTLPVIQGFIKSNLSNFSNGHPARDSSYTSTLPAV